VRRADALSEAFHAANGAESAETANGLCPTEWCALYINLARRVDRREKLLGLLASGNAGLLRQLQRIDAVDGQFLDFKDESLREVVSEQALERAMAAKRRGAHTIIHEGGRLLHFDNHLTLGGVACAMSHLKALQAVADHPTADWGLILEDDVCAVVPRAEEVIAKILEELPDDWDALFLGFHDSIGGAHPAALEREGGGAADSTELAAIRVKPLREPLYGLFAWVVRKEAARALVENAFPIGGQVDHALSCWLLNERGRSYTVDSHDMVFFSPKSEVAEDSDIQTMMTSRAMMDEYESLENYYNRMWGLDAMLEDSFQDYILGIDGSCEEGYERASLWSEEDDEFDVSEFLPSAIDGVGIPPADAPTPDCAPAEWLDR